MQLLTTTTKEDNTSHSICIFFLVCLLRSQVEYFCCTILVVLQSFNFGQFNQWTEYWLDSWVQSSVQGGIQTDSEANSLSNAYPGLLPWGYSSWNVKLICLVGANIFLPSAHPGPFPWGCRSQNVKLFHHHTVPRLGINGNLTQLFYVLLWTHA